MIGVVFVFLNLAEVERIVDTLQHGDWRFLVLALAAEVLWIITVAADYQSIYEGLGIEETIRSLLPVSMAAFFVNVVTPTAGMSGMAVFVAEANRRNHSPGKAAIANALYLLFDFAAFLCIQAVGMLVLFRRNSLNFGVLTATGILVLISLVMAWLIYLGVRSADELSRALVWMSRRVNRVLRPFIHRDYLSETRAHEFAQEAADGLKELLHSRRQVFMTLLLALLQFVVLIAVLFFCFKAFDVDVSPGTLIAGFSIGYLFTIVSPTPGGIGFVEGALPLALTSMYVKSNDALVVTLAYRAFTFWLPTLVGMFAFRMLNKAPSSKPAG
jgi:hypothetical protein